MKKKREPKQAWCSFRTSAKFIKDIESIAKAEGRSRSTMIVRLIEMGRVRWAGQQTGLLEED